MNQSNQSNQSKRDLWDNFFGHPTMRRILEEADLEPQMVDSDDDPVPGAPAPEDGAVETAPAEGEGGLSVEQLAADFQQGSLSEEDLINLYKAGKISKDEIEQVMGMAKTDEEPQSEEELLAQQVDQTNDMFVKFALYDKITDLSEKLDYFKDNFDDIQSDIYDRVIQLREFLNILSSLIFSIETSISYQMYGSILLQLTELFTEYNKEQSMKGSKEDLMDNREQQMDDLKQQRDLASQDFDDSDEIIDHEDEKYREK